MKQLEPAKINITIKDTSDLFAPYYRNNKPVINSDLADLITMTVPEFKFKQPLELHIYSDAILEEEQEKITDAIHNYYSRENTEHKEVLNNKMISAIIFIIIGFLGLCTMILLDKLGVRSIWTEIVDIFSWVFIWGSVDLFFIQRANIRRQFYRNIRLIKMNVFYHNK